MTYYGKNFAIEVDACDWDRITKHSWYLNGKHNIQNENKVTIGRFILDYNGPLEIDHRDRNIFNNKRDNLRLATRTQQLANRGPFGNNKYKGVSWDKQKKIWRAHICINYKVKHIGCFHDEDEAAKTYNNAAWEAYGEYAYLNKI